MARLGVTKMIDRTFKTGPRRIFSVVYRSMPEGLVDVVDALRSYRCSSATNRPIFLHIPKTGGITVSRQIYGKEVLHNRQSVVEKLFDLHDSLRFVAIMREPIQRFISAANFIRTGGTMERRADYFRYYDDIDWEDIESIFFALLDKKLSKIDPVFRPQSFYLDGNLDNLRIYTIDNIEVMLRQEFGIALSSPLQIFNRSTNFFSANDLSISLRTRLKEFYESDFVLSEKKGLNFRGRDRDASFNNHTSF